MLFAHPLLVAAALGLLPFAVLGLRWQEKRRQADAERFGERALLERSSALPDPLLRAWQDQLFLAALFLALLALARPQFGETPSALGRHGRDVLVLLDLSRSMNVADVAPSRLEVAKRAALAIISGSPGDRVGLVIFGGSPFLQLPLSLDHSTFEVFLEDANTEDVADPSTNLGAALTLAATLFEHEGSPGTRVVLLVSDGESFRGNEEKALERLRRTGARVFALGVGTPEGGPVPERAGVQPVEYHRDAIGRVAVSRLDEGSLRSAARATGGDYLRWSGYSSEAQFAAQISRVSQRELSTQTSRAPADRFQWPLALSFMALLAAWLLGDGPGRLGRNALALAALVLISCQHADPDVIRGTRAYAAGEYKGAYDAFRRAAERHGTTPELRYRVGNTLYRLQHYDQAAVQYQHTGAGSPVLRQAGYFNLGNAYVRAAEDTSDKRGVLRQAIHAYQQALVLDPDDVDARYNLELAIRKLNAVEDAAAGAGPRQRGNWGRGNLTKAGYAGAPEAGAGATAGGGFGDGEGESAHELSQSEARELVEGVERQQLKMHEGRNQPPLPGSPGHHDW